MESAEDDGLLFLNIGDSWNGGKGKSSMAWSIQNQERNTLQKSYTNLGGMGETRPLDMPQDVPHKCKLLIPHRVAIGLIDAGWILRNDLIWSKPNAMPESVRDRFSKKFEYIFMLSKTGKYYFDLDGVREEQCNSTIKRAEYAINTNETYENRKDVKFGHEYIGSSPIRIGRKNMHSSLLEHGKNPGDIWTINTQPSPEKHYAMWPESLVERMILCSTKSGDAVLDPFAGSACTLRVADKLNREAYGIDLGYQEIQERRMSNIQKEIIYEP
jgi:site-specific DNA-methyltransferase (cytosine-N4-specific)